MAQLAVQALDLGCRNLPRSGPSGLGAVGVSGSGWVAGAGTSAGSVAEAGRSKVQEAGENWGGGRNFETFASHQITELPTCNRSS